MYKVFFNDKLISISSNDGDLIKYSDAQLFELESEENVKQLVNHFLKSHTKDVVGTSSNLKEIWRTFKQHFKLVKAAGGVVENNGSYLFIFRRGKWDLPKGKIDKGEKSKQAAVREVEEECGITNLQITKKLGNTWHIYSSPYPESEGEWILKKTVWFEMAYRGNEVLTPEIEEDIVEARWIKPENFVDVLKNTYPNLEPIIKLYC